MHVDNASKTIFFHNPKTGGRSIIVGLGLPDDTRLKLIHFSPREARRCIFQDAWHEFFTYSFVRNPWERMVSLYEYHRSVQYGIFQKMNLSHTLARQYNFDEWIAINQAKIRQSNWFGMPQAHWMDGVTRVYRFEDFDAAFKDISERMNKKVTTPHINRSNRSSYQDYYRSTDSIDIVGTIDAHVIKEFGYQF
ncbi:sulfotransferase family 2 domain-containing protein [Xanthomonas sp. NCPPB 2632]|uniref:sulfotransferase family 2 domain-containing protein n=1 Tax=Xanthomonas sp. NCPPB 2632 TaxID=3240912 RepID=UPI00351989D7